MTFWDFANQHPWMAAAYALGFWLLGVILASSLERKPKPGFKSLKRRLRALEDCPSSEAGHLHKWEFTQDLRTLKCKFCDVTKRRS